MKKLSILFLIAISATMSFGQQLNVRKLDSLFSSLSANNLAMGSIAISKGGKIVYQRAIGYALKDGLDSIAANADTEYRIGSITKMFTATMIFQLLEEKKLSMDEPLANYFPSLPNAEKITISNLLNHRSGLPDFTKNTNFDDWKDKPKTQDELLAFIAGRKPDFEPGAKADYNNSNYLLLGYIIEKVCKESYKDVLQKRIVSKIKLTHIYYGNGVDFKKNESASYNYADNKWIRQKDVYLNSFGGAGAIVSTSADLVKFIEALFAYKLVSQSSLDKMKTMVGDYGMGMFPYSFNDKTGYGHNGKTEGFASSLSYYPKDRLTIAYCTNGEVYPKAEILNGVLSICYNMPYVVPTFNAISIRPEKLDQYVGSYSSTDPPIKVVCSRSGADLTLETSGQVFVLKAIAPDKFMNVRFGFFFDFNKGNTELVIKESGMNYYLNRQ